MEDRNFEPVESGLLFSTSCGWARGIKLRLANDFFSNTQRSKRASHITIESHKPRRIHRIGGELNPNAGWIRAGLQRFIPGLVIPTDEVALELSLENLSSGQI